MSVQLGRTFSAFTAAASRAAMRSASLARSQGVDMLRVEVKQRFKENEEGEMSSYKLVNLDSLSLTLYTIK